MTEMGDASPEEYPPVLATPDTPEIKRLEAFFSSKFHSEPEFIARVPGRVNLIGEHIDYSGYSVCPMAIQQHILFAFKSREDSVVNISNIDDKYEDYTGDISHISITVDKGAPSWYQYLLCGVKGIIESLPAELMPRGFDSAVLGTIPPNAGLSSSSALVCAATLALSRACKLTMTKLELASCAAKSERFIGTMGGGMDQAIAFLATQGCAKLISFNPLSAEDLVLPEGAVFVIANSLVEMNKAATADFNCRVAECRLVTLLLAKRLGLDWKKYTKLVSLQRIIGVGVAHLKALARETLHEKPYTKKELMFELSVNEQELQKVALSEKTKDIEEFKLAQRLTHVAQEVERVQNFVRHCKTNKDPESCLWYLGDLMKQSHESLKTLYECSHEELDKITLVAQGKTHGARLTGAGWGGCTVALATEHTAQQYITALKDEFYAAKPDAADRNLDELVFATEPGPGAAVYVRNTLVN